MILNSLMNISSLTKAVKEEQREIDGNVSEVEKKLKNYLMLITL
jgi:SMC interacting uncharacterized protein involved in chromosome segregation